MDSNPKNSSAEIHILIKVGDLAKRYGMRPSEADACIDFAFDGPQNNGRYIMSFTGMTAKTKEAFARFERALGANQDGDVVVEQLSELEDIVDQALARAPRSRTR